MNPDISNANVVPKRHVATGVIMGILFLSIFLVIYASAVAPILPTLQAEFGTTPTWTAWTVTIYVVAGIVTLPIIGKLGDLFGKKKLWIAGMSIFTISVMLNGFAWNLPSFILFRAFSGFGLATFPLSYGLIRDLFPAHRIAPSLGILTAATGAGATGGQLMVGVLTQAFGWRSFFFTAAPVAIALVLLASYKLEESPIRAPGRLDLTGAITITIALLAFLVAMTQGAVWGWTSAYTIGLLVVSLIFSVLFVALELRVVDPMLHLKVFRTRNVFFTLMTAVVVGVCTYTMVITVPYLVRTPPPVGLGFSVFETGLIVLPGSVVPIVVGPYAGTLVNKWGGKWPLVIGSVLLLLGFVSLFIFSSTWPEIALGQAIIGGGVGFTYTAMATIIVHSLPREETGVGSGVYTVMRSLGNVIGPTVAAAYLLTYSAPLPISSPSGVKMVSFPTVTAFYYIFVTTIVIALIGVVTSLIVRGDAGKMEQSVPAKEEASSS
ncbi:MAG: MFS transporter [Halobacteriota archaeon]